MPLRPLFTLTILLTPGALTAALSDDSVRAFVAENCFDCHANGQAEGEVNLDKLTASALVKDPALTRQLIHVLDTNKMPPKDAEQPTEESRRQFLKSLRPILHQAVANDEPRTPIRRMNRFQYNNAVTDLFDLKCNVFTLPERAMRVHRDYFKPEAGKMADSVAVGNRPLGKSQMIEPRLAGVAAFPQDLRAEHGYDNQADHLSLSPLLMEELLKLGQSITQSPDFNSKQVGIWKTFFAAPSEGAADEQEISKRLIPFLTKAFRGSPDKKLLNRYVQFVLREVAAGVEFSDAMKSIAAATISSPRFIYLYDRTQSQSARHFNLASKLAFFLWGSLPDERLLSLAGDGDLSKPEVLKDQVGRMLRDRKLKRFCDSFPAQWLQLDRIVSSVPNRTQFPQFYYSKYRVSMHMMMEPLLIFETVLVEDMPITQLIDSDFTYRSAKLTAAYGQLAGEVAPSRGGAVGVLNFHRVPVTDRRVGGVITNAAVMTMTSGPERTQPITRGAWVAGVIFNDPPEPPPADVPPLAEEPSFSEKDLTLRERLAMHRERSDCRGCHEQIDPLGFALENFNPVGQWRDTYENGRSVDSSGEILGRHTFSDVVEFKDAILAEKDRFCRALAGHMLSYSLARELGPADELALDGIVEAVAADEYKMQSLIQQVILSRSFREE